MTGSRSFGVYRRTDSDGKPTGSWIAYGYFGPNVGTRQKTTRTTDKKEAMAWAAEWFAGQLTSGERRSSPTIKEAWGAYRQTDRYQRMADYTKASYDRNAEYFMEWVGEDRPVDQITDVEIRAFRDSLDMKPGSVNTILSGALARVFDYSRRRAWIDADPMDLVERLQDKPKPLDERRMFTAAQMDALEQADPKSAPIWALFRWTGARRMEGMTVEPGDIGEEWILLRGTKNSRARRHVPLMPPLKPYLPHLTLPIPLEADSVRDRLLRTGSRLGIERANLRMFRRAYITFLMDRMGPTYETVGRLWAGHGRVQVSDDHYRGRHLEFEREAARSLFTP